MIRQNDGLPDGWVLARIADVVDRLQYGYTAKASNTASGPKFLRITDIKQSGTDWTSVPTCEISSQDLEKYRLYSGDIVFARTGSIEKAWRVENPPEAIFASYLIRGRPIEIAVGDWLAKFVQSKDYLEQISAVGAGIGRENVNARNLGQISFPLPPLAEQRRIVAKIEALQERSRRAREALSEVRPLLEHFRQSMLAAAFRGDLTADWRAAHPNVEPASELLHRIRAERRRRWEQVELATSEAKGQKPPMNWKERYKEPESVNEAGLPALPEGWAWSTFDEVSLIDGGLTKHEAKRSKATACVPLISVAAVQHGYIDSTQVNKIGLLPTDGDKGKLETNDLLIVEGNGSLEHIGRAALWDGSIDNARHQNHLIRVRPVLLDPRFALYWLGSPRGRTNLVAQATSSAGLYNLSLGKVGRVSIPIPPLDEQTEIVKQLDAARTVL